MRHGEVFGFHGPNGAGKTTTIRTVLDLLHPTSGSARLFGPDSRRDSLAIRTRLGNLPGEFAWDPRRTGREVVSVLAELRGMRDLGRADELAARLHADLDRPIGHAHGRRVLHGGRDGCGDPPRHRRDDRCRRRDLRDALAAGRLAEGLAGVWALALFFAGCATLATGLLHRAGLVLGTVGALFGAMYLLDIVGKLSDPLDAVRLVSAMRW